MAKRVYLSPSDQRRNTYAVGDTTEAIQCGRIAEVCKAALERSGVEVMLGQYDTMANRVAESNRFKADLHVPIHSNACNGKASGTHLFCYSDTKDAKGNYIIDKNSAGYKACKAVMDVLGPLTPGTPDVIRAYPALYEVKHPAATTVYIETDFHDVPRIAQWIIDNTELLGETIAKGLCAALGVPFVESANVLVPVPAEKDTTLPMQVRMLKRGMEGADVKTLQAALIAYGFSCGAAGADGDFGSGTEMALKKFQTKYGLGADGIAGKGTWGKLLGV